MKFSVNFNRNALCVLSLCAIFWCYNLVHGEKVRYQQCDSSRNCDIVNVSLSPCPEASQNKPCKLYRGTNVTWSFDYIPKFSGSKLTLQAYGHVWFVDVPYPDQDRVGCKFTKCPVVDGELRHLEYTSQILRIYPAVGFTRSWSYRRWTNWEVEEAL